MDFDDSYDIQNELQFWSELEDILSVKCDAHAEIDNVLRSYLGLTTKYKDEYLDSNYDVLRCSEKLIASHIFEANADYVRRQIIYCLLQEESAETLHIIVSFLILDGRHNESTLELMNEEGAFARLLELIQLPKQGHNNGGTGLHRLLMDLMYEMSRIQRIKIQDLVLVDDEFVKHLFQIIEELSDDANDPYHYPVIRVLLVLNEQFMVSAHDPVPERSVSAPPTNKVIKVLSIYGSVYKTFGENIILLLNRESETSLQLLTLKLLYLLFTTPSTYEYFYTNDLRVLVDILIRNLLDLPEGASALRHTYLRVLYPLLAHTQLSHPPHYKRDEVKKLLGILVRNQFWDGEEDQEKILHFDEVDETTRRLVLRCCTISWLVDEKQETMGETLTAEQNAELLAQQPDAASETRPENETATPTTTASASSDSLKTDEENSSKPALAVDANRLQTLEVGPSSARSSSLSVMEVAVQREKPGIMLPSREDQLPSPSPDRSIPLKQKPEPPRTRRWRGRRGREEEETPERKSADSEPSPVYISQLEITEKRATLDRATSEVAPGLPRLVVDTDPSAPTHDSQPDLTTPTTSASSAALRQSLNPPAVPPPRRSSHSVPPPSQTSHGHNHHRHYRQPPPPPQHAHAHSSPHPSPPTNGHPQKPEPPRTRRWWGKKTQETQNVDSAESPSHLHHESKPTVPLAESVVAETKD